MKSEPSVFTFEALKNAPNQTVGWIPSKGIRNYQVRNFMRDQMLIDDKAFFYQSNCDQPGIVGIMSIVKIAYPDPLQFIPDHKYYDPKSSPEKPIWLRVDVKYEKELQLIELKDLRNYDELKNMKVLQKGNRLSISPVTSEEWEFIKKISTG